MAPAESDKPVEKIIVVGNATYDVCVDSGQHVHPGHIVEIADGPLARRQIADRKLVIAPALPEPEAPATPPAPSTTRRGSTAIATDKPEITEQEAAS